VTLQARDTVTLQARDTVTLPARDTVTLQARDSPLAAVPAKPHRHARMRAPSTIRDTHRKHPLPTRVLTHFCTTPAAGAPVRETYIVSRHGVGAVLQQHLPHRRVPAIGSFVEAGPPVLERRRAVSGGATAKSKASTTVDALPRGAPCLPYTHQHRYGTLARASADARGTAPARARRQLLPECPSP
jgi:hypothetical protein